MSLRRARPGDWQGIRSLLDQLEYPGTEAFLKARVAAMVDHPDEVLMVYEEEGGGGIAGFPGEEEPGRILGFISLHFIPQIALAGDFARISYFSVDSAARSRGIGQEMEAYCTRLARERGCELIEVHCHTRRVRAHAFYARQGYEESPKYLIKRLK